MKTTQTIIFVCEHGAAKSVVAAAYFNKLADERKLNIRAIARGTTPDAELSPIALAGLINYGLTPAEAIPQKLSQAEFESAKMIVSFCGLPEEYQGRAPVEQWINVPPISEDYERARDVIVEKLRQFINSL